MAIWMHTTSDFWLTNLFKLNLNMKDSISLVLDISTIPFRGTVHITIQLLCFDYLSCEFYGGIFLRQLKYGGFYTIFVFVQKV